MLVKKDLYVEIVRALEAGVDKQLNRSFLYSPFRLFYNIFKKNNPQTMDYARQSVRHDVEHILEEIPNFNSELFIKDGKITKIGRQILQKSYSIGIHILKKKLTVVSAFKALRDNQFRTQIYNYMLSCIKNAAIFIIKNNPQIEDK